MKQVIAVLAGVFCFLASQISAQVQSPDRVLFVLDGSNSMWGQIGGVAKISIAKEVMTGLISDVDATIPVGLMIYGHRREGDCFDIEHVADPATGNRDILVGAVQDITPRGKTPISLALSMAGASLLGQTGVSSVVLVSDGLETCDADPCGTAGTYEILNPGMDVHVIGFDVTAEEGRALACIAEASGGQFFRADTAQELEEALARTVAVPAKQAAAEAPDPAPPVPETPPEPERTATQEFRTKLCASCDGQLDGDADWTIRDATGAVVYQGLGWPSETSPPFPPGSYVAEVGYHNSTWRRTGPLVIGDDGTAAPFDLDAGRVQLSAYAGSNKQTPMPEANIEIFAAGADGNKVADTTASGTDTWLPAGDYRFVAHHDGITTQGTFKLAAAQTQSIDIVFHVGHLDAAFVMTDGGAPITGQVDYRIFATDGDSRREVGFVVGSLAKRMTLVAGSYEAEAYVGYAGGPRMMRLVTFDIAENEVTAVTFDLDLGLVRPQIVSPTGRSFGRIQYLSEAGGSLIHDVNHNFARPLYMPAGRVVAKVTGPDLDLTTTPIDIRGGDDLIWEITLP